MTKLRIPLPEYQNGQPVPYPGDIQPGEYSLRAVIELLRKFADNPDAVRFIADMLEP